MSAVAAPLCRFCGKQIAKRTERFWCHREPPNTSQIDVVVGTFRSKAEVQRVTNQAVVSVQYHEHTTSRSEAGTVWSFTTWDGATYVDETFCTGTCARAFGYAAARMKDPFITTAAYRAAVAARRQKQEQPT